MSRRSHNFADGNAKFSWKLGQTTDENGRSIYRAECKSHPAIFGVGVTEQVALTAAKKALEKAVDSDQIDMQGPGQL